MLGVTYKQEDEINATNFKITNIWCMKLGHINQQGQKKSSLYPKIGLIL